MSRDLGPQERIKDFRLPLDRLAPVLKDKVVVGCERIVKAQGRLAILPPLVGWSNFFALLLHGYDGLLAAALAWELVEQASRSQLRDHVFKRCLLRFRQRKLR